LFSFEDFYPQSVGKQRNGKQKDGKRVYEVSEKSLHVKILRKHLGRDLKYFGKNLKYFGRDFEISYKRFQNLCRGFRRQENKGMENKNGKQVTLFIY
jgi:hypothetical protein